MTELFELLDNIGYNSKRSPVEYEKQYSERLPSVWRARGDSKKLLMMD